jgi:hypothetical protein
MTTFSSDSVGITNVDGTARLGALDGGPGTSVRGQPPRGPVVIATYDVARRPGPTSVGGTDVWSVAVVLLN